MVKGDLIILLLDVIIKTSLATLTESKSSLFMRGEGVALNRRGDTDPNYANRVTCLRVFYVFCCVAFIYLNGFL